MAAPVTRRAPERQRGQSILLAVIGLVVLAIGMYTTYNLSRAVYEKIKLQTAADAAAYSLATLEARSFNFIAFSNRAQVANYVQMLEAQSILSSMTFVEGYVGWGGDMAGATGEMLVFSSGPFLWIRAMGEDLIEIGHQMEGALRGLTEAVGNMEKFTPMYIQLMTSKNQALLGVSMMLMLATTTHLALGGKSIAEANDPHARLNFLSYLFNAASVGFYLTAFDYSALNPNGSGDDSEAARRVMSEVTNASRYASQRAFGPDFIVSRPAFAALGDIIDAMMPTHAGKGSGIVRKVIGQFLEPILAPGYVGTSKMLAEHGKVADIDETKKHAPDASDLVPGDALAAKDQSTVLSKLFNWNKFASVVSGRDNGQHCRYHKPDSGYGHMGFLGKRLVGLLSGKDFKCDDKEDNKRHIWKALLGKGGIQPYLKFQPDNPFVELTQFDQPDVWVWLNKKSGDMSPSPTMQDLRMQMRDATTRVDLDTKITLGNGILDGMNALARAQVYYHRPGAWHEPPNFFNPYWDARLAPKSAGLHRIFKAMSLPSGIANFLSDNVQMH